MLRDLQSFGYSHFYMFLVTWSIMFFLLNFSTSHSFFPWQVEDFVKAWVGCSLREVQSQCSGLPSSAKTRSIFGTDEVIGAASKKKGRLHLPMKNRGVSFGNDSDSKMHHPYSWWMKFKQFSVACIYPCVSFVRLFATGFLHAFHWHHQQQSSAATKATRLWTRLFRSGSPEVPKYITSPGQHPGV